MSTAPAWSRRAVLAATVGNALEFYDFVTFAFFSVQIGRTFFPSGSAFLSLMGALATFGAGFLTRPLGALILGGYADRVGRRPAMVLSFVLMGVSIAVLALTPSYAMIGVAAPVIAIVARLVQGFSLGGEIGSSSTYMLEAAPPHSRGLAVSWQAAGQSVAATFGALVGLLLSQTMSAAALGSYGWRIALLIGVVTVPFGLMIRRSLPETLHDSDPPADPAAELPVVVSHKRLVVLGFFVIAAGTISNYIFQYMATFGQTTLHLSGGVSLAAEMANNGVGFATALIGGWWSDRYGRKPIMVLPMAAFVVSILPTYGWLVSYPGVTSFIGGNIILSLLSGFAWGPFYAALIEGLPRHVRSRVFALTYSLAIAIFGGTTQPVVAWLIHATGSAYAPAWYMVATSAIGVIAMALMPETAPRRRIAPGALEMPLANG